MNQTNLFDVLVVYSGKVAKSANDLSDRVITPFTKGSGSESYNLVYSYFLTTCEKNNLKAAFATSSDIMGAGKCNGYWTFKDKAWVKTRKDASANFIFDKFSPTTDDVKKNRELLFSSVNIKAFNNPRLFNLCFDKQKTYSKLRNFAIPTLTLKGNTDKKIAKAFGDLREKIYRHPNKDDFSDEIIMKDRFGAGGRRVYKFGKDSSGMMIPIMDRYKNKSFIIQPYVKFDKGFVYNGNPVSTEIRIIYLRGKIVQTYIRMAKEGEFRCNEHRGGVLKYIPIKNTPSLVVSASDKISKIINNRNSLYALDFIISNKGTVYLLEANTGPGLDWNLSLKENETEAKKLIRIIIKEIVRRTTLSGRTLKKTGRKPRKDKPVVERTDQIIQEDYMWVI